MWDKIKIATALSLLSDFKSECWQLDKTEYAEIFSESIAILKAQFKMLNDIE